MGTSKKRKQENNSNKKDYVGVIKNPGCIQLAKIMYVSKSPILWEFQDLKK